MPNGVLPRPAFAVFGDQAGASKRVAPIGFDLSNRGHGLVRRSVPVEAAFSKLPPRATKCCPNDLAGLQT